MISMNFITKIEGTTKKTDVGPLRIRGKIGITIILKVTLKNRILSFNLESLLLQPLFFMSILVTSQCLWASELLMTVLAMEDSLASSFDSSVVQIPTQPGDPRIFSFSFFFFSFCFLSWWEWDWDDVVHDEFDSE